MHVRRQVRIAGGELVFALPKGGKTRDVPLASTVALRLAAHLQAYPVTAVTLPSREPAGKPETHSLVFTTPTGPLSCNAFNDVWLPARKRAGIGDGRENGMHALRHHDASILLEQGVSIVSIKAVSEYLGHTDPGFTLRTYAQLMPSSEDRARAAVDAAFGVVASSSAPDVAQKGR